MLHTTVSSRCKDGFTRGRCFASSYETEPPYSDVFVACLCSWETTVFMWFIVASDWIKCNLFLLGRLLAGHERNRGFSSKCSLCICVFEMLLHFNYKVRIMHIFYCRYTSLKNRNCLKHPACVILWIPIVSETQERSNTPKHQGRVSFSIKRNWFNKLKLHLI